MSNYYQRNYGGNFFLFPPVIKNLLIINGVVFFLQLLMENFKIGVYPASDILTLWFALNPINILGYAHWPFNFQVWQLLTYQFMHGGFSHIFFNMFALWMFGAAIENVMGSKKFLIFYLLSGISAGVFHLFLSPLIGGIPAPTIGASGAIYGVLIAYAMYFPDSLIFLYFFIPIKAKYFIGFMILLEFFAVDSAADNVAHLAHLGGALFAFLYLLFDKNSFIPLKNSFRRYNYQNQSSGKSIFDNFSFSSKKKEKNVEDAKFYDLNNENSDNISQKEIDEILDKISQSGYQNLTEREKKILFEASKKMNRN